MNQIKRPFPISRALSFKPGVCAAVILLMGTGVGTKTTGAEPGRGNTAAKATGAAGDDGSSAVVLKSSSTELKRPSVSPESLPGRGAAEVEAALGKPSGKLQTALGATWLYPDWQIRFDTAGVVTTVEKDQPVRLAKVDPRFLAAADAVAKADSQRAAADDAARIRAARPPIEDVRVISEGGAQVDLPSLLADGKITIVDFYADWCGPCKRISPLLEQLAKSDPDVVLLKVDIVEWNTPVTAQFGINSIPNVRVFNRSKTQVGESSPDVNTVLEQVRQAKAS